MIFILCGRGLLEDNVFPSQFDLSIVQAFLLPYLSPHSILREKISRDATRIFFGVEMFFLGNSVLKMYLLNT
jgi:hypothetical protein